ncbi:hypothetical protein BB934_18455 [Microvirga ossetica]|uniref:Uncharacterized protein n=1 Tax=Microvirga ossetica TaxID=1882682 RepID=A0A1B2EIX8_9HYPH|nr:hypothetical protein [Microvirga ossetica]ANY79963.1 hypothetical protein BB934_18455 [Microvirga ossetica]
MAPRQPPENPDDDRQSDLLRAVHRALNDAVPVNVPVEEQPLTEMQQDLPEPESVDETQVEIDRIEAYMKGPTAFTA